MSLKSIIESIDSNFQKLLSQQFVDEPSWSGLLTYTHAQFLTIIIKQIDDEIEGTFKEGPTSAQLLEFLWTKWHLQSVRYFHLQFHRLKSTQLEEYKKLLKKNANAKPSKDDMGKKDGEKKKEKEGLSPGEEEAEEEEKEEEDIDETNNISDISSGDIDVTKHEKSFKSKSKRSKRRQKNKVEHITFKKIFDIFIIVNKSINGLYTSLARSILKKYDCRGLSPNDSLDSRVYDKFKVVLQASETANLKPLSQESLFRTKFLLHRILFFQGNLSRYRTLFNLYVLSSLNHVITNSEKQWVIPQLKYQSFDKAVEHFTLSNRVLPGFGDPLTHIGMIMNSYGNLNHSNLQTVLKSFNILPGETEVPLFLVGDKFEAVYYFILGAFQRFDRKENALADFQHALQGENAIQLMSLFDWTAKEIQEILQDINTPGKRINRANKNKAFQNFSKVHLLALISHYTIEGNSFGTLLLQRHQIGLQQLKLVFFTILSNDIHYDESNSSLLNHQFVVLIGSYQILMNKNQVAEAQQFLEIIFEFIVKFLDVVIQEYEVFEINISYGNHSLTEHLRLLLPNLRVILNWIASSKTFLDYSVNERDFALKLAFLINKLSIDLAPGNTEKLFSSRMKREWKFTEDYELDEFIPIGCKLKDFDDSKMVAGAKSAQNESRLRAFAIGWLGKHIIQKNSVKLTSREGLYDLDSFKSVISSVNGPRKEATASKSKASSKASSKAKAPKKILLRRPKSQADGEKVESKIEAAKPTILKAEAKDSTAAETNNEVLAKQNNKLAETDFDEEKGIKENKSRNKSRKGTQIKKEINPSVSQQGFSKKSEGNVNSRAAKKPAKFVPVRPIYVVDSDTDTSDSEEETERVMFRASDDKHQIFENMVSSLIEGPEKPEKLDKSVSSNSSNGFPTSQAGGPSLWGGNGNLSAPSSQSPLLALDLESKLMGSQASMYRSPMAQSPASPSGIPMGLYSGVPGYPGHMGPGPSLAPMPGPMPGHIPGGPVPGQMPGQFHPMMGPQYGFMNMPPYPPPPPFGASPVGFPPTPGSPDQYLPWKFYPYG